MCYRHIFFDAESIKAKKQAPFIVCRSFITESEFIRYIFTQNLAVNILKLAKETILKEADALRKLADNLHQDFELVVQKILASKGRVIVTGVGKSAIVAQKIVATFNSTGTQSIFMHAADAVHGDLGMIDEKDVIICISKSGSTSELRVLVPILRSYGVFIIGMTAEVNSFLAEHSDLLLHTPMKEEADPNKLAPTTSTTLQSAMGDALAISLLSLRGFTPQHFAKYHPGGLLGKQLYLKVNDLMGPSDNPQVSEVTAIKEILLNMSQYRLGATTVVDDSANVIGVITDGDLRRWFQKELPSKDATAKNIMTKSPKTIDKNDMAISAFRLMTQYQISQLPVKENGKYVGMIHMNSLLREGFV